MLATLATIFIVTLTGVSIDTQIHCVQDGLNKQECLERGIQIKNDYPLPLDQRKK